jgi:hypothetical protein
VNPAPLDVRVARVIAAPVPFLAYFLIRVPQVTEGGYVPWAEAVPITILTMALFPMWLYWCADLVSWRRDRPTLTPDEFDATEGAFVGELPDVAQGLPKGADGKFAAVPMHRATNYLAQSQLYAAEWAAEQHEKLTAAGAVTADGEIYHFGTGAHAAVEAQIEYFNPLADPWFADSIRETGKDPAQMVIDDRPTEPMLLTHEFTPASGIALEARLTEHALMVEGEAGPVAHKRVLDYVRRTGNVPTGRHRKDPPMQPLKPTRTHLPPIAEVENADAYSQLNRTRELPFS